MESQQPHLLEQKPLALRSHGSWTSHISTVCRAVRRGFMNRWGTCISGQPGMLLLPDSRSQRLDVLTAWSKVWICTQPYCTVLKLKPFLLQSQGPDPKRCFQIPQLQVTFFWGALSSCSFAAGSTEHQFFQSCATLGTTSAWKSPAALLEQSSCNCLVLRSF